MKCSSIVVAAVLILAAGRSRPVEAQSATAQAEALFRQGKELMTKGKIGEACAAFDASQKLEPTIPTLLNQASCREKNGQLATAWGQFLDAERQSRAATDEAGRQLHQVATDHAAKLEPRLSTLAINVPADSRVGGLEILRNNEPIDPGAWNKPLPVDGGSYKITARAPGNAEWSSTVTVGSERDARSIDIPKLKAAAVPLRSAEPGHTSPDVASSSPARSKVLPFVLGGVALGLAGGAVGLELWARSTYDKSTHEPDNARQDSLWHSANNRRYAAEALGIAGFACAGTAIWLYLRSPGTEAPPPVTTARLQLQPLLAPTQAGLLLSGSY